MNNLNKIVYPAADRNKEPILQAISQYLPKDRPTNLLEISSGSGQHIAHIAPNFPNITFQPSEYEKPLLKSINAYAKNLENVQPALLIDVISDCNTWNLSESQYEFILNINMMHITPKNCTEGLFCNSSKLLKPNGYLFTYGPYANNGMITPASNVEFDRSLRQVNPEWGLKDIACLEVFAQGFNLNLVKVHDMPANNKFLAWKKSK